MLKIAMIDVGAFGNSNSGWRSFLFQFLSPLPYFRRPLFVSRAPGRALPSVRDCYAHGPFSFHI